MKKKLKSNETILRNLKIIELIFNRSEIKY